MTARSEHWLECDHCGGESERHPDCLTITELRAHLQQEHGWTRGEKTKTGAIPDLCRDCSKGETRP